MGDYRLTKYRGDWCIEEDFLDNTRYIYSLDWLDEDKFDGAKVIPLDEQSKPKIKVDKKTVGNISSLSVDIELDADEFEADINHLIAKVEKLNEELSKLGG